MSLTINLSAGVHTLSLYAVGGATNFSLAWSGPETMVNGVAVQSAIAPAYLSHVTTAGELTVHPTAAAATKTWVYYPTGNALAGLMQSSTDADGKVTQYAYDSNRRLAQVQETGDGGSLVTTRTLTYDGNGNLASTTDALGRTITYAYDSGDRLIKTSYADGSTETVTYGTGLNANLVVAQKDRDGSVTALAYDTAGRLITSTAGYALADVNGNVTTILPQSSWSVTTNTYLSGDTNIARSVTNGKVTQYDYDYKSRVIATRVYPNATTTLATATTYDTNEVRFMDTDAYGRRTFYAYRPLDMILVRQVQELIPGTLGALANEAAVLALTRDASPNPAYLITDYAKDLQGRTTVATDPRGINTAYAYDSAGRTVAQTAASRLPVAQSVFTVYDPAGNVTATADSLGRVTTRTYTPAERVGTMSYPNGDTQSYTYYADGKTATQTDPKGNVSTLYYTACCGRDAGQANALGQGTLKFYDGVGHVTYSVVVNNVSAAIGFGPNVPSAAVVSANTMRYDARGRVTASTKWLVAPASVDPTNPPIATDPTQGLTTTYAYFDDLSDARFATVLSKLAAQGVTLTTGSATLVTSPTGESSFSIQDGAGRTVASGVLNKSAQSN